MRRVYSFQCAACGMHADFIWESEQPATDEDIPQSFPCRRLNCQGELSRARSVWTDGKQIGWATMNHDGDLVLVINPDLLTPQQRQDLNPNQKTIHIRIPERTNNG